MELDRWSFLELDWGAVWRFTGELFGAGLVVVFVGGLVICLKVDRWSWLEVDWWSCLVVVDWWS